MGIGKHVLIDLYDCQGDMEDVPKVLDILKQAAITAGATILQVSYEKFDPQGLTAVIILAESHLSIHTYPEHGSGYAAIDLFTCGDKCEPSKAIPILEDYFLPKSFTCRTQVRGQELDCV